jgi:hypothetical protein
MPGTTVDHIVQAFAFLQQFLQADIPLSFHAEVMRRRLTLLEAFVVARVDVAAPGGCIQNHDHHAIRQRYVLKTQGTAIQKQVVSCPASCPCHLIHDAGVDAHPVVLGPGPCLPDPTRSQQLEQIHGRLPSRLLLKAKARPQRARRSTSPLPNPANHSRHPSTPRPRLSNIRTNPGCLSASHLAENRRGFPFPVRKPIPAGHCAGVGQSKPRGQLPSATRSLHCNRYAHRSN